MTPKQQPDLTQALADLQTVRDAGWEGDTLSPAMWIADVFTRNYTNPTLVRLASQDLQATITKIMGWAGDKHRFICEVGNFPERGYRYQVFRSRDGFFDSDIAPTPLAAHLAVLRAIAGVLEGTTQLERDLAESMRDMEQQLNNARDNPEHNDRREAGKDG